MTTAQTSTERVAKLRADRAALGLKRMEIYAHPEDWGKIKGLAFSLNLSRLKTPKKV